MTKIAAQIQRINARIMLVDDEPDINAALSVVLKREGYDVDTFDNPFIALEKLKPGFYGLIILDVKMPQMDGFELYREIKKVDRKAKICFLTASELYYENFRKEKFAVSRQGIVYNKTDLKRRAFEEDRFYPKST